MSTDTRLGVGLYIDAANIQYNGGWGMAYDVLREFACRDGGIPLRLNSYVTFDAERARRDHGYRNGVERFHNAIRDMGFKVIVKEVKRYRDDAGNTFAKANADLDMAVDALMQSDALGRVVLSTGDGDFVRVVQALQNRGCRVEVIAFDNVSASLRREADFFLSGYLIPNLLPSRDGPDSPAWGEKGSLVRGVCYHYNRDGGFGFVRYLTRADGKLWITDTRRDDSPYASAFFSMADVDDGIHPDQLLRQETVLEFRLGESQAKEGELQAFQVCLAQGVERSRGSGSQQGRVPSNGPRGGGRSPRNGHAQGEPQQPAGLNGNVVVDLPDDDALPEVDGNRIGAVDE
ncbi:MAG: NYN domain-containing protein [Gammaproteobacteria bacterium]|nr:NYN domain-containing protein [Gammaproteobacteria bacterium]